MSTDDILAMIDNSIRDTEVSNDAMRWAPDGAPETVREHNRRVRQAAWDAVWTPPTKEQVTLFIDELRREITDLGPRPTRWRRLHGLFDTTDRIDTT